MKKSLLLLVLSVAVGVAMAMGGDETTSTGHVGVAGFPVVFYTPETSLGIGGGLILTFRNADLSADERPDSLGIFSLYTLKNQVMVFAGPEVYVDNQEWKLALALAYRDFPDQFYGLGNDTSEDEKEDYTSRDKMVKPSALWRLFPGFRVGGFYEWKRVGISALEQGGLLDSGVYPGVDGAFLPALGPVLEWDTRDSTFSPTKGQWVKVGATFSRDWLGSDHDYESLKIDARQYVTLKPSHVLAMQVQTVLTSGDVPFFELPSLDEMRGVLANRFRDEYSIVGQLEYRFPIKGRWSGVAFGAAGDVFGENSEWNPEDIKYSGGAGMRYMMNTRDRINFRLDVGVSPWGGYPYIRMMEAF